MKFSHIENHWAFLKTQMKRCRGCGEFMVDTYTEDVVGTEAIELRLANIPICTDETGVCESCQKKGGHPIQCSICKHYKKYPQEFAYKTVEYDKYEFNGEATIRYICKDCVEDKPQAVILLLADSDDTEKPGV